MKIESAEASEYDFCGNPAVAVVSAPGLRILLCKDCLNELKDSIEEYEHTTFCFQCKHFRMSKFGWNYGGSCQRKSEEVIRPEDYGYNYNVSCMETCKYAKKC